MIVVVFSQNEKVKSIWDEAKAKWWFSVLDIVAVLNAEGDYAKVRNYWKYLELFVRNLRYKFKNVYIVTGPLYLPQKALNSEEMIVNYNVIGNNFVAVPTHFFKVVLVEEHSEQYKIAAFVLPNKEIKEDVDLVEFLTPADGEITISSLIL